MSAATKMEVPPGFGPGNEGFADLYLTTYSVIQNGSIPYIVD